MKRTLLLASFCALASQFINAQTCTPLGDQTSFGTNDVWIGYAYNETDLTTNYAGYINQGTTGNPSFDQNFGGSDVNFATNGCDVATSTFSVRYKLKKTFTPGNYEFTVGGDDGFRLSIDGGATWYLNRWNDQSYTVATAIANLNGEYDLVLEYFENGGDNRISFQVNEVCIGLGDPSIYGTNNTWNAHVYDGINFNLYKGRVHVGGPVDPSFDQNFDGDNVIFNTNSCSIETETFSVRYLLRKTFTPGFYTFNVGGDDGYRFSLDGGATWQINNWNDHSYTSSFYGAALNGQYDMVIEFYENGGGNRVTFNMVQEITLPITLESFTGTERNGNALLSWVVSQDSDPSYFEIEKSKDGSNFTKIGKVTASTLSRNYNYTDLSQLSGKTFYRMKMVDQGGKVKYSQVVAIQLHGVVADELKMYPTILTGSTLYLETNKVMTDALLTVTDVNGRVISQKNIGKVVQGQIVSFTPSTTELAKGMYFVQVSDNNEKISVKRFIVQ